MSKLTVEDTSLVSVADAIRTKGGTTNALTFPDGFVSAIEGIQSGGGGNDVLFSIIDRSITEITASMLYGCTVLGNSAFARCSNLTSVIIPSSVTTIGQTTFQSCNKLLRIDIPNSVTTIGNSAFNACMSLTSIDIPNSVTTIGNDAFSYSPKLNVVKLFSTTPPTLGTNAFYRCSALTQIIVPAGSLNAYRSATNWSAYADKMVEASS